MFDQILFDNFLSHVNGKAGDPSLENLNAWFHDLSRLPLGGSNNIYVGRMSDDKLHLAHLRLPSVVEESWLKLDQLLEVAHVELPLGLKLNNILEVRKSRCLILDQDHVHGNVNRVLEVVEELELLSELQGLNAVFVDWGLLLNYII